MQDKTTLGISDLLREYIEALVEEVVMEGQSFDDHKSYLRRYCENDGVDHNELEKNLTEFFSALEDLKDRESEVVKNYARVLGGKCYLSEQSVEHLLKDSKNSHTSFRVSRLDSVTQFEVNGAFFNMIKVNGGAFLMGCDDDNALNNEKPVHEVIVDTFYMGETVVTQDLWKAMIRSCSNPFVDFDPNIFKGNNFPLHNVRYTYVVNFFLPLLNELTGMNFRLPTETEWEYAARGGNKSEGCLFPGSNDFNETTWCKETSNGKIHQVMMKKSNELGLYDMSGNVWEWCSDLYGIYGGSQNQSNHVLRGGSWMSDSDHCRVYSRDNIGPDFTYQTYGLRLALSL